MTGYIIRRLLGAIPTLLVIVAVAFFMMRAAPGGPFDGERRLPPEIERNILAAYDLDLPLWQQFFRIEADVCSLRWQGLENLREPGALERYGRRIELTAEPRTATDGSEIWAGRVVNAEGQVLYEVNSAGQIRSPEGRKKNCVAGYLGRVIQGDFGPSFKNKDFTVNELIASGAPVSVQLGLSAITIAVFIGTLLGVFAALNQNRPQDFSVMTVAMVGITIPTFVTAPLLTLFFGVSLGWLPVGGYADGQLRNLILPVTVLALPQIAIISRLVRGSMIEVMRSNYVRTARAKGLPETTVVIRHALRAGLLPLVSYLGPAIAGLVTGSLVVEQIFQLPGIGRYFVQGALNRDYTLVLGVLILYASLLIFLNLVVDVLYRVLDPKVRYS